MFEDLFDSEIISSPKFWIPIIVSSGVLLFLLNSWRGKLPGLTGYAIVGIVVIIGFSYFWAGREMDK